MAQKVGATLFKAQCLALLDRVAEQGVSYVIEKRGRPVARLVPIGSGTHPRPPLVGCVTLVDPNDDLLSTDAHWEVEPR